VIFNASRRTQEKAASDVQALTTNDRNGSKRAIP
jgi:hypothetical protein